MNNKASQGNGKKRDQKNQEVTPAARRKQVIVGLVMGAIMGVILGFFTQFWLWVPAGLAFGLAVGSIMKPPPSE